MKLKLVLATTALALSYALPITIPSLALSNDGGADHRFTAERVFDIEYAGDPQISPDGKTIAYVRHSMDRETDTDRGDIWVIDVASGAHRPLITGEASVRAPRWSPDGSRLLYSTRTGKRPDLRIFYMDSGRSVSLGQFFAGPGSATWSPDGKSIAFTMFVKGKPPSFAKPVAKPNGVEWAKPVRVFDDLNIRFDGAGYLKEGARHVFTISANGGSPRQITTGDVDFGSPAWLDNKTLLVTGNEAEDRDLDPIESEIYRVSLKDLARTPLTDRDGPDAAPTPSPDGKLIAYAGYDDDVKSYQMTKLFLMDADGKNQRALTAELDHGIDEIIWASDGKSIYVQVENAGAIDVMEVTLDGKARKLFSGIGGTSIGRHYAGGSFTVSKTDTPVFAYTAGFADRPAEVAVKSGAKDARVLTALNDDLLTYLDMAPIEELKVKSSVDGREIEAWVALPPGFKADGSFPMVLEIHGGPFTMYAPFFASEIQRYAAEGYVTLYVNPRGSTGYGEDFAQLIDRAYPGDDVQDLMDMVDLLVKKNYVDEDRLFVTGGSGGGILTAWIVTKTNRFAAAASVKPVINWMTMALAADIGQYVRRHWIREDPWTNPEAYLKFSPISYVHQVKTPTLMMVGEEDFRTPTWEAEQFYTGLKMNGVETALIRVPGSSHYIARRPSQLIAKTDNIMGWFKKHDPAHKKTDGDK